MNKIFKSGGKWQVLKKRVSPAVIAFQALLATALVMFLIMLLKYNPEAAPAVKREFRQTTYLNVNDSNFNRLLDELDPSAEVAHAPAVPKFAVTQMVKFKLYRPQLVTEPVKLPEFKTLPTGEIALYPDFRTSPETNTLLPRTLAMAVLYDQSGKELGRWQTDTLPDGEKTIFRIEGSGALQHTVIMTSCGNNSADRQALVKALALHLDNGIYSVWYPTAKRSM